MPAEFLSDDEAAYGRYAGTPSQGELDRMFYLDDADRRLVARRRGDPTRQVPEVSDVGSYQPGGPAS